MPDHAVILPEANEALIAGWVGLMGASQAPGNNRKGTKGDLSLLAAENFTTQRDPHFCCQPGNRAGVAGG